MDVERFDHLVSQYLDGLIEEKELDELNGLIIASAEARQAYWRRASLHAQLREQGLTQAGQHLAERWIEDQILSTIAPNEQPPAEQDLEPIPFRAASRLSV